MFSFRFHTRTVSRMTLALEMCSEIPRHRRRQPKVAHSHMGMLGMLQSRNPKTQMNCSKIRVNCMIFQPMVFGQINSFAVPRLLRAHANEPWTKNHLTITTPRPDSSYSPWHTMPPPQQVSTVWYVLSRGWPLLVTYPRALGYIYIMAI